MTNGREEVLGISLSHPTRVLWTDLGFTKLELARFHEAIGQWSLPHLQGRPLTLFRCPKSVDTSCYFMKHSKVWAPDVLRRVQIEEKTKVGEYLVVESIEAVVGLVQMDVVELHTWNSRIPNVEYPDRVVMDLDPGPEVSWRRVVEAARLLRQVLTALGLQSFVKTTGGVGLHVVVPLAPTMLWSGCLAFARALAEALARQNPRGFTTAFAKKGREDKILIDYLRNNRTNTSVAAYSPRARAGAPVSTPIDWDELSTRLKPSTFTVRSLPRRLARLTADPWAASYTLRQKLPAEAITALSRL